MESCRHFFNILRRVVAELINSIDSTLKGNEHEELFIIDANKHSHQRNERNTVQTSVIIVRRRGTRERGTEKGVGLAEDDDEEEEEDEDEDDEDEEDVEEEELDVMEEATYSANEE